MSTQTQPITLGRVGHETDGGSDGDHAAERARPHFELTRRLPVAQGSGRRFSNLRPDKVLALQKGRLRQIIWLVIAALLVFCVTNFTRGTTINLAFDLGLIVMLLLAHRWNQQGRLELAAAWMIVTLLVGLCGLMAVDQGLYDEVPLAFPALLVFAGMFGSRKLLVMLMVVMLAVLAALYALHEAGILLSVPRPLNWRRPLAMILIIVFSGFFVWLLAGDLLRNMVRLEAEKLALQASRERIALMARHDSLTGLPNRSLAMEQLQYLLGKPRRGQDMIAVMFLDLDNFKTINDSLSHSAGDELLCKVGEALSLAVRGSDMAARMSGDEFLIVLGDLENEDAAADTATRILQALSQPFVLDGVEVPITASLGIALAPRDGNEPAVLLKHADLAMYQAKDAGRNAFRFFDASVNQGILEHLQIASGLHAALAHDELEVHYQPKFDLGSGRVVGAEALLRWPRPDAAPVSVHRIIEVAERSGLIHEVGAWVLRQACDAAREWRRAGLGELAVSVNVSPLQFRRGDLEATIREALAASALEPGNLELEMTESTFADTPDLIGVLRRLGELGVRITIDDFGTGYSNLAYLQRFDVHSLKIDQSFVRNLGSSAQDEGLVRAIIEMSHCLGMQATAEGIEDAQSLARLRDFGCEFGQGFLWAPALPIDQFIAFVRERHAAAG